MLRIYCYDCFGNGHRYSSYFQDGKICGYGFFSNSTNTVVYGKWFKDVLKLYYQIQADQQVAIGNNGLVYYKASGKQFYGQHKENKWNGYGQEIYENRQSFGIVY